MGCLSLKNRYLLLISVLLIFTGWSSLFAQINNDQVNLCTTDQYTFDPGSTSQRDNNGYWTVIKGTGTFSDVNHHSNVTISNISFGENIYHFIQTASIFWGDPAAPFLEHKLTIYRYYPTAGRDTTLCYNVTSFQLNGSDPSILGAQYKGKWTTTQGSGSFSDDNSFSTTVTGFQVGVINKYRWTITRTSGGSIPGCGNSTYDEISITIPPIPNAYAGVDQNICPGASATLTATAGTGYTYAWSTGQTSQSISVTPAASANYKLTVTDANKCQATDNVDVNISNITAFNLTSSATTYCAGGTGVTLTLSGSEVGVNYQLKNGAANDGTAIAGTGGVLTWANKSANISPNAYTVVATNATSLCTKTMNGSVTVTSNPTPTAYTLSTSFATYCTHTTGVTLTLNNSQNGTNYEYQLYKNGAVSGSPLTGTGGSLTWNNITAGSYFVRTTNTLTGCISLMSSTPFPLTITSITSPSLFNISGTNSYCQGSNGIQIAIDGSESGKKYQLVKDGTNDGASQTGTGGGFTWTNKLTGTYTVVASNADLSCSRTMNGSAVSTEIALPTVFDLTAPAGYCAGGSGVSITLSGSQTGIDYKLIKNGASISSISGTGSALMWNNMTDGTYQVQASTTGSPACPILMDGTLTITAYSLPVADAGTDKTICQGGSVQLNATGGNAYSWSPSAALSNASIQNPVANPTSTTLYTVTVTNSNGCSATDQVQVVVNIKPVVNLSASASTICASDSSQLSVTGGTTYLWNTGNTSPSFWAKPTSTTYYSVIASNIYGCKDTADFTLNVNPQPTVNAGSDKTICKGASASLTVSGADTYTWSNGQTNSSITVSPALTVNYSVTGKITATGCIATDNVLVTVNPLPVATFTLNGGANSTFCISDPLVTLTGNPNAGGSFTSSTAGAISGNFFDPAAAGAGLHSITYTYTDANSCTNTNTTSVSVVALPVVNLSGLNATNCSNSTFSNITGTPFQNGSGVFGTWTFSGPAAALTDNGDGTAVFNPASIIASGNYTITYKVANASGCFNTATKSTTVNLAPTVSFIGLPSSICQSATPVTLTGNMAPSGTFSGLGITDLSNGTATYNPSGYIPNNYNISYTYQDPLTLCTSTYTKAITVKLSPSTFSVTGGGSYCQGNAGLPVGLSNSSANIAYELFLNGYTTNQTIVGSGASFSFGNKTTQGTYTVVATDPSNSCVQNMAGSSAIIMNPLPADAQAITGVNKVCPGTSQTFSVPAIANTTTYQWALPTNAYITSGSGTNSVTVFFATNAVSGNLTVYGQNSCGNGLSSTLAVAVSPLPAAAGAISGKATVCQGETNVIYSIGVLSDATSYLWKIPSGATLVSGQGSTQIIVNYPTSSTSGSITVYGINSCGNGTSSSKAITVVAAPQLTVNAPSGQITCAGTPVTVSATSSTSGSKFVWTGINGGHIVTGDTTPNPSVNAVGDYVITLTEPINSCTTIDTVSVLADNAIPQNVNITATNAGVLTCTISQVTLTAATSSIFPVSYTWSYTSGGNIVSGNNTSSATVDKGSVYAVKVTNLNNSCFTTRSITITEAKAYPDISVVDPETEKLTCSQATVTLSSNSTTSGVTYNWSGPGNITNGNTTTPVVDAAGTYTVSVTAPNGCISTKTVWVQIDSTLPAISINTPASLTCTNATITLNGSSTTSGATLLWSGPGIVSGPSTQTPAVNLPGNYTLTITHPLTGCKIWKTITVAQDLSAPFINYTTVPPPITCSQLTSNIITTVNPANSTLLWTGPGSISDKTIPSPIVNAVGNYSLTATHPITGCTNTRTFTVGDRRSPANVSIAAPSGKITCSVPSITLHGNTTLTKFKALWTTTDGSISGNAANLDVVVTKAGSYTLTITNDTSGCTASQNVTVTADNTAPYIIVDKNPALLTCTVSKVTLYGASDLGNTLLWTGPAGSNITDPTTTNPKVDAIGNYTLTVTAPNGCTSSNFVTVGQDKTDPGIPAIKTPAQLTCSLKTVQLEVSPLIANSDYLWTTSGTGSITNAATPIATVDAIGTYTVRVTNRTSGCTNQNSITVSMNNSASSASIAAGPYIISCTSPTLVLDGSISTGINPLWTASLGGHITKDGNTFKPTVDAVGTYTITTQDATTGCSSSASISVTSSEGLPTLTIDAFPPKLTCSVSTDTLSGKPTEAGTTYTWTASPGHFVSGSTTFKPVVDQPGTYILTVTKTATGCINTAAIEVKEDKTAPSLAISTPAKITCTTTQVQINTSTTASNVSYLWATSGTGTIKTGNTNVANPVVLSAGTYNVTLTDQNNQCTTTGNVTITDDKTLPDITVNKTPSQLTCTNTIVTLSGSSLTSGATYKWETSGTGNIINPTSKNPRVDAPGTYRLTVTNPANGCTITDSVTVTQDNTVPNIWVDTNPATLNCTVTSVKISGNSSTSNVSYNWSGPGNISDATLKEPNVDAPGIYNLTVTSLTNGCTSMLPVTVSQNKSVPAAPISNDTYTCFNSTAGTLTAVGTNIKWYSDASLLPTAKIHDGNTLTPTSATAVGNYSYFVTQTDAVSNCESPSSMVTYSVLALPAAPVNSDQAICQGTANPALQAAGSNIRWYNTPGGSLLGNGGLYTPPASISASGTYIYYATQTDANNCQSAATPVTLTINPIPVKPVLNTLSAAICIGSSNPTFTASGTNIKWYDNLTLTVPIATGSSYTTTEVATGIYPYYVTQTNAQGCTSTYETVTFSINALPQKFNATGGGNYCADQNGIEVGLDGSELNTTYQLLLGGTSVVGTTLGNGSAFDFGLQKTTGTYTIMATTNVGCQSAMNGSATISSTSLPDSAKTITGPTKVCQGINNQVYTVAPIAHATSYIWAVPPGATIISGQGTNTIIVDYSASAASGVVTVKGSNSCNQGAISTLNITVVASPQLSINTTPTTLNCNNISTMLTASSSTAGATFTWTPINGGHIVSGPNTATPSVDAAGDYTVTVLEPVNFCTAQNTVTVIADLQAPQNVTITASNGGIITCLNPTATLSAATTSTFPVSYNWTESSGGHIVSGNNTANLVIDKAGVYDLLVTNLNTGCTATQNIIISEQKILPDIAVIDPASQKLSCSIDSIILYGSSATPGTTFNWTGPKILHNGSTTAPTVGATGIYTFTVTAPNGCISSKTVQVLADYSAPALTVNSNPATLTCANTSISLSGASTTSGATLQWTGPGIISGSNTQTPVVNQPGLYTLTAYHPTSNCTSTAQVTVSQDILVPTISFPVIPATLTCSVPQTTVTGSTSVTNPSYLWTTGNGFIVSGSTTSSAVVSKAGTYLFKVTNLSNGCSSNASLTVLANQETPNAQIAASSTITCTQPSVTLAGSSTSSPVSVNWTTSDGAIASGLTSFSPVVTKGGTYVMTVTNTSNGCIGSATINIQEDKTKPVISIDKTPATLSCGIPFTQLNGNASGASILWTGPSGASITNPSTSTPTVNKPGRYYLTATRSNGCTTKDSTDVSGNFLAPQNVSVNAPGTLTCTNTTLQLTGNSGTTNALFAWSAISGGNILSSSVSDIITIDAPGTYKLVVSHPSSLCKDSVTVSVLKDISAPSITFPVLPTAITCKLSTSTLNSSLTPSNATLLWTGPGTISNATIVNPVVNVAGIYTLTATNPTTGCKTIRTLTVPEDKAAPDITIDAAGIITCIKPSVTIHSTTSIINYTALWSTSNGTILGASNLLDVVVTKAGLYTLTITNNDNGCSTSKNILVTADNVRPDITVDKNPAKLTCLVSQVELFGTSLTPSAIYSWTGPGNISGANTQKPKVDATGNYILTITSANGCSAKDTITVTENKTVPAIPNILAPGILTCAIKTVNLEISPVATNVDYIWSTTGSGTITNGNSALATIDAIGTYTVLVTERTSGCTNQTSVIVSENKTLPTATITGGPFAVSCANGSIVLDGSSSVGINPVWTSSQGGHIVSGANALNATIDAAGMYTLTVTDAVSGCTNSANMPVTTSLDKPTLTIDAYPATLNCSVTSVTLYGQPTQTGTSFAWTASPGNIVSGPTTFNPVVDQPGTYILTVTDNTTGCSSTAAIEVKQDKAAPLLVIAAPAKFTCTTSEIQLNASSTDTNVTYNWSTTGTGSIKTGYNSVAGPIVLTPGTYTVTITDFINKCSTVNSVAVMEDRVLPDINVDKNPPQLTCTSKQTILSGSSLTAGATYKWSTTGGGNIINALTSSPTVDAIGYYKLTVLNPVTGCTSSDSVLVTYNTTTPNIWVDTHPDTLNCKVSSITIRGNSSTSGVTYLWSGPGNITDATLKEPNVDSPGTYYLTITSPSNGCTASLPVEVVQNTTIPAAPVSTSGFACLGATAPTLSAIGNNIKWYSNGTLTASVLIHNGNSFTPSSATTAGSTYYFVTQTDPKSLCEGPATQVTYSVLSLPSAPVNIDNSVCQGLANSPLQASGTNIQWYDIPGGTLLASASQYIPPASISAPGTYTYFATQTDANGCQSPAKGVSLVIHANPAKPVVDKLIASVCQGNASNPSFLASGSNIKWYASSTLPAPIKTGNSFTSLETSAGTYNYYVTETSSYGCISPYETVSFIVKPLPQKFTVTGGGVYCEDLTGLQVGLNGSESSAAYQLLLNGTNVISALNGTGSALDFGVQKTPGSYTIVGSGNNGCPVPMTGGVSIVSTPLPAAAGKVTGQITVCQGTNAVVYQVDTIGHATSYIWDIPAGAIITAGLNSNKITVNYTNSAVSGPIRVYGANACGTGTVSPDIQVVVNHIPAAASSIKYIAVNNAICLGDSSIIYEIDPIAYATDYEWIIPTGASVMAGANTNQIKVKFAANAATGNQIVKVRGTNNCGKGDWSAPYAITVNPNPTSYAGMDQNICSTTTSLQGSTIPTAGIGTWNLIKGSILITDASASNSAITSVAQGENILTWTINAGGCHAIDTVKISNNQLYVDAGPNIAICGEDITLKGSAIPASSTGIWSVVSGTASFANGSLPNTKASKLAYGDNKLYWMVSKNGCNSVDSVTITNYQPTTPDAGGDQGICINRTTLSANQPVYGTGQWSLYSGAATFADINMRNTSITKVASGKNLLVWTITNQTCRVSDTVIITNNETIVNAGHDMTLCDNRTTLSASAPPTGGIGQWSVLKGSASFLDGSAYDTKVSGLVNGSNILMWSIMKGSCINTDTVEYICNMPTSANAGSDQFIAGNSTTLGANQPVYGSGKWSVMSGSALFTNDTLFNTVVSNLNPGANILRWSITNKGCTLYDDVVITNGTIETVDAGQNQIICASETKLEAIKPQYGFGVWTVQNGSAIFEDNEAYNSKVTNLASGDNILRWSVIVSGIEYYDTVIITNNKPTTAVTGTHQTLCGDSSMLVGNIPIQGSGRWTLEGGSATIDNFNQYNSKVTLLGTGDNTFRWTITKGSCTSSALLVITNDKPTVAYAGSDQIICDNKTELFPNTPFIGSGEWSVIGGSGSFTNNQVTALAPGKNTLKWTIRNNNCTSSDIVDIISHKPTTANAGNNTIVCSDSLFLSANKANSTQGETASWSVMNGAGTLVDSSINTTIIKRLAQGVNVLRWTINNNGCISYDDVEINYASVKSVAGEDIKTCLDHVILNANNPSVGTGEWSVIGGSGTAVFVNSTSANSEVKNLDQGKNILRWTIRNFSCISTSELTVTNNAPSVAFAGGDQNLCVNTTTLSAKLPLVGIGEWSVLSGSGSFSDTALFNTKVNNVGVGTNTYRWTIKNADCSSTDEVVITNNKPINTFAGTDQQLCIDSAQLSANSPVVGTGVWSIIRGSGMFIDAYNPVTSIQSLAPDTNVLRWTVSNKQCVEYKEIKVINNYPTIASAGADKIVCAENLMLDGNVPVQGSGEWSVISGSATFPNRNLFNSEAQGLLRGKNVLRWKITKEGCYTFDDVMITNDLPTQPVAGTTIAICDNTASLNGNKSIIGKGYWKLLSGSGTFIDSTIYNTRIVGLGQGSNYCQWTISHNLCTLSDVVEVRNNRTYVYAGADQTVFENTTMLFGNPPSRGTGIWKLTGGAGDISAPGSTETTVTGLGEGLNTFEWDVDIEGCISSDRIEVTYKKLPTAAFSVNTQNGCPPLSVKFSKTTLEDYDFRWNFGYLDSTSTAQNTEFTYDKPGKYIARLTVEGPDGNPVTKEKVIEVYPLPDINFDLKPEMIYIPEGELRCFNYTSGGQTYLWNFGDGTTSDEMNPKHIYTDSGKYTIGLKVWTEHQCVDSVIRDNAVHVLELSVIKFPSAFTPNMQGPGDGTYNRNDYSNDVFYPIVINGGIQNYKMQIFNRWGVQIFESNDISIGWDGYYKGKLMSEDVYIYKVTGNYNSGKKLLITGDVLLMHR
jgi:gliding motility-associated-like protein